MKEKIKRLIESNLEEDIAIGFSLLCENYNNPLEFIREEYNWHYLGDHRIGVMITKHIPNRPTISYKVNDNLYLCANSAWIVWQSDFRPTYVTSSYEHN